LPKRHLWAASRTVCHSPLVYSPCWRDIPPREFANYLPDPESNFFLFTVYIRAGDWRIDWLIDLIDWLDIGLVIGVMVCQFLLADRTAHRMIGIILWSVCPSVCNTLCIVAKRYKWIGSARGIVWSRFYNFWPPIPTPSLQTLQLLNNRRWCQLANTLTQHTVNKRIATSAIAIVSMPDGYSRHRRTIGCSQQQLGYLLYVICVYANNCVIIIDVVRAQVVVGNSANWVEAAETLTELAHLHRIQMNEPVYFSEPYVGLLHEMPSIVDRTYRSARSEIISALLFRSGTAWSSITSHHVRTGNRTR